MTDATSNETIRVLIVDDEALARLRIRKTLEAERPTWVIDEAQDGVEALEKIASDPPQLMFLDVEMPELSGFDVLRQLGSRSFSVIFQTAYDQFAVKAFDENACDYLLKPFTDERLLQGIDKALTQLESAVSALDGLEGALIASGQFMDKFVVNVGNRSKVILQDEVVYFLSEDHITRIVLPDIDYAYDKSLNGLEEHLDPSLFFRTHRNSIVRIDAIASLGSGAPTTATLRDGREIAVSRERARKLRTLLKGD